MTSQMKKIASSVLALNQSSNVMTGAASEDPKGAMASTIATMEVTKQFVM